MPKNVKRVVLKRKLRSKKQTKVSTALKSYVHRALSRNEETKIASVSYSLTGFNSGITNNTDLIKVMPIITQGTTSSTRVGNAIRPVKMVIRGYVVYNATALNAVQDARMLGARLMCFQDKTSRSYSNAIYNFNLLEEGDGTSGSFTGLPIQFSRPHNNDQFVWYADKRMKILKPFGYTNNTTPSATNAILSFNNSMYHPFTITLTQKKLPARLIYDQTDDTNYPTNWAPQIGLGYADLLGASADTGTVQVSMQFEATLYYKDA